MKKRQKDKTLDLFTEAFHEVVVPVLQDFKAEVKAEFKEVKDNIDKLDNKVEMYTRKFVQVTDHHGDKLDNHEKRIRRLESKRILN